MQKFLIPTDFSREAENALQTAIPIAKAFNSTMVILHILEIASKNVDISGDFDVVEASTELQMGLKVAQENLARSITLHNLKDCGVKFETIIRIGSVSNQIESYIKSENIDFVVMGTKSAWGLSDILLGTTTDKLLRRVDCPVLSVNKVIPTESFKKIVFPTTTFNKEKNLVAVIKTFQRLFDSKIYLVRINTPLHFKPDNVSRHMLEEFARKHDLKNYEVFVFSHTEEEDGIRDFADIKNAGLIAVATSAHTGLRKLFSGSVTKELVSHSTRPVLTMKVDES